jgi:hypothetical protein
VGDAQHHHQASISTASPTASKRPRPNATAGPGGVSRLAGSGLVTSINAQNHDSRSSTIHGSSTVQAPPQQEYQARPFKPLAVRAQQPLVMAAKAKAKGKGKSVLKQVPAAIVKVPQQRWSSHLTHSSDEDDDIEDFQL